MAQNWTQVLATTISSFGQNVPSVLQNASGSYSLRPIQSASQINALADLPVRYTAMHIEFRFLCALMDDPPFYDTPPSTETILAGRPTEAMNSQLPGAKELLAVRRIKSFLRPRLLCAKKLPQHEGSHLVAQRFAECLERSQQLPRLSRNQRLLFLGPLPHALVCLDALKMYFSCIKDQLASKLQGAGHIDLEESGADVARVQSVFTFVSPFRRELIPVSSSSDLVVQTSRFEEMLQPGSRLYVEHDWHLSFKDYVREIGELVDKVEDAGIRKEVQSDWALAYNSMVFSRRHKQIR